MERLPQNQVLRCFYLLTQRYIRHNVGIQSAALAFYLLFTIFPLLIFLSALLGLLDLNVAAIEFALLDFLPREVVDLITVYLTYVSENPSPRLMVFGLFFSIWFPMRSTNALMHSVRTAYHLGPPRGALRHILKALLYTVVLIVSIALTLTLITVGDRLLGYAVLHFRLPTFVAEAWVRLRFPVVAVVGNCVLFLLYALAQDQRRPWRDIWPGTLIALGGWMGISLLYSLYVERVAHYSALYGSIGTVIVLLIWLYLSAVMLIMGAEFNGTLISLRRDGEGEV